MKEATRAQTKRLTQVENALSKAQNALSDIHSTMEDSGLYEASRSEELTALLKDEARLTADIETLEEEWLLLEAEIEEITDNFQ